MKARTLNHVENATDGVQLLIYCYSPYWRSFHILSPLDGIYGMWCSIDNFPKGYMPGVCISVQKEDVYSHPVLEFWMYTHC